MAVRRVATLATRASLEATCIQTWYSLSVPATSHKRCGSTANAFLSLTRNSGSTISTPSPYGTSPISFHSQGQKRLLSATILPLMRHESREATCIQTWYFLSVPATSHERRGSTAMAFRLLTRNSDSTVSTPSPCGTSPISLRSQGQKR